MRYRVTRTSDFLHDHVPCEEAVQVEQGPYTVWEVEINSIDELTAFIGKYGMVVIGDGWLEIYDTYRE